MVKAQCTKCTGIGYGKTREAAADAIDHAIGLGKGRKCPGKGTEIIYSEESTPTPKQTTPKTETKTVKTKASTKKKRG